MISRPTPADMLEAACVEFAESGFRATTMDAVAARARSTKPTLYAHFGSKDELYRRCTADAAEALRGRLFRAYAAASELPLEQQVRAGMVALFDFIAAHPARFRLLFGSEATGTAAEARQHLTDAAIRELTVRIRDFTARHGREPWGVSAELCAAFVVGLTVEGARHALFTAGLDPTSAGEFATSFTVAALRHIDPALAAAIDHRRPRPDVTSDLPE